MTQPLTYKKAGVDISKANRFVDAIKQMSAVTINKGVINRPGSFGALFGLSPFKYKNPVLVSSTDGVGTKLLVANLRCAYYSNFMSSIKLNRSHVGFEINPEIN